MYACVCVFCTFGNLMIWEIERASMCLHMCVFFYLLFFMNVSINDEQVLNAEPQDQQGLYHCLSFVYVSMVSIKHHSKDILACTYL